MTSQTSIAVAIIGNHKVQESLGQFLAQTEGCEYAGRFKSLEQGLESILERTSDDIFIAVLSAEAVCRLVDLGQQSPSEDRADYRLTPHEIRLLGLLVNGHSYKSSASILGSATNTVAFHLKKIYRKLRVHSKAEAVAKALRERLIG